MGKSCSKDAPAAAETEDSVDLSKQPMRLMRARYSLHVDVLIKVCVTLDEAFVCFGSELIIFFFQRLFYTSEVSFVLH